MNLLFRITRGIARGVRDDYESQIVSYDNWYVL